MTSWVGEHREAPVPAAAYGVVLLMAGVAYLRIECGCVEIGRCPIVGERVADMRTGRRADRSRHEPLRPTAGR